jgi:hypothetical protein
VKFSIFENIDVKEIYRQKINFFQFIYWDKCKIIPYGLGF